MRSRRLLYVLVAIGVLLRVAQYLSNRSLWVDESWLALNLLSKSFGQLTGTLDFGQGAPVGFLFVEEFVSRLFGFSEYVLRLFPLICGIASLVAFAWLARRVLPKAAAPLAVLMFAVADALIYYSSELKPYADDVAASIALVLAAIKLAEHESLGVRTALLALGGLILVAFSFPAVFVIAAVAVTFAVDAIFRGSRESRRSTALAVSPWLLGCLAVGVFATTRLGQVRTGHQRFLGVEGSSSVVHALNDFGTNVVTAMGFLQGQPFRQVEKLALLLVVIGIASLLRRERVLLFVLLLPFAFTFIASGLRAYPISVRTELFLLPPIILLLVEGVAKVVCWTPRSLRTPAAVLLAVAVAGGPTYVAAKALAHPRHREEMRPVLEFVRDHWRDGDTLYVHYGAQYAFLYYEECKCLRLMHDGRRLWPVRAVGAPEQLSQAVVSETPALVVGWRYPDESPRYVEDLRRLKGRGRVWFLYSHFTDPGEDAFIRHKLVGTLDAMGRRLTGIDRKRAHAYLYDLR